MCESGLQVGADVFMLGAMTKLVPCCCAAVAALFFVSCADDRPQMPSDQANKVRTHRIAPSEDLEETARAKEGSPVPPTREGSWKF